MTLRSAHGRARELGRLVVSECPPIDELPSASPSLAAPAGRDAGGRFTKGNRVGAGRRLRAGRRGALIELERKGDPAARAALAFGRRYAAHRRAELARAHGGELSAGAGAMVESAGELLAAARYWSARSVAEADPDLARLAATLVAGARQSERDAWHLAALERAARPRDAIAELERRMARFAPTRPLDGVSTTSPGAEAANAESAPDGNVARATEDLP